jgi:hypothetical protein
MKDATTFVDAGYAYQHHSRTNNRRLAVPISSHTATSRQHHESQKYQGGQVQGEALHFSQLAENREMHAFSSFLGHVPLISRLDRRLPGVHAHNLKHGVGLDLCGHAFAMYSR